ncbi:polysaccharide export outer membrane protein [Nitratireductor aquibiodomus]|uniref:Polysaccharide export outer membrane protein n=2 Tax=Nitratireductor aquibiodomus TaxID=204799 RepID=A0A1H4MUF5_9HYPH|nr:polysaccharide biosynthesis/export family protein [Nitratireductor aquibiodomus]SEB86298.1 polysaccharide export outer membrane protein [Nitratireductor aquibiodomus]
MKQGTTDPTISFRSAGSFVLTAAFTALVFILSIFAGNDAARAQGDFQLLPQTRVKIAVVEWVEAQGEYREWTALNGEYTVSPAGMIALPLVGQIAADGRTSQALAGEIAAALQKKTGLISPPATTVEVVRYPSVFVTGSVERPGEFEFNPGLSVLQALAMAGGRVRRSDQAGGYSELEQIRYAGEIGRIDLQLLQLATRRARLEAELVEGESVDFDAALQGRPLAGHAAQFVRDEKAIFEARRNAYQRQRSALDELGTLFREEIRILGEKMVAQDRQIKIAEEELGNVAQLVKKGTVTKSRETGLERIVADLQSSRLDLAVASMRARQRLSETERDALSLEGTRRTEIGAELQRVNLEIDDLELRRGMTEQLLQATGASILRREDRAFEQQPLRFSILRGGDEKQRVDAVETTGLEPGDVLDVQLDLLRASMPRASLENGVMQAQSR